MRYPLWAFFFFLVLPPFTAHALFTGQAQMRQSALTAEATDMPRAFTHQVITR